jgi:predicted protein tyrosine phosphatase
MKENPKEYHLLLITDSDFHEPTDCFQMHAKSCLHLRFDNISCPQERLKHPEAYHVERAIRWSKDKDLIICSCHTGISRSSAMAYVLACFKSINPRSAVNIFLNKHNPNWLIIKHGSEILNNSAILTEYYKWIEEFNL